MYDIIKEVIKSKNYELTSMLKKIDTVWIQGALTDEQRMELIDQARANADPKKTMDLYKAVEELEARVRALEENKAPAPTEQYPEYVAGKRYKTGDKITFKKKHYECICPKNTVCVWNSEEFPAYWKAIA